MELKNDFGGKPLRNADERPAHERQADLVKKIEDLRRERNNNDFEDDGA